MLAAKAKALKLKAQIKRKVEKEMKKK